MCLQTASSNALEFEAGIGHARQPFYTNVDPEKYPDQYENRTIGKLGLSHTFNIVEGMGVKLWLVHYSLAFEKEPAQEGANYGNGLDIIGASVTYKFF